MCFNFSQQIFCEQRDTPVVFSVTLTRWQPDIPCVTDSSFHQWGFSSLIFIPASCCGHKWWYVRNMKFSSKYWIIFSLIPYPEIDYGNFKGALILQTAISFHNASALWNFCCSPPNVFVLCITENIRKTILAELHWIFFNFEHKLCFTRLLNTRTCTRFPGKVRYTYSANFFG